MKRRVSIDYEIRNEAAKGRSIARSGPLPFSRSNHEIVRVKPYQIMHADYKNKVSH